MRVFDNYAERFDEPCLLGVDVDHGDFDGSVDDRVLRSAMFLGGSVPATAEKCQERTSRTASTPHQELLPNTRPYKEGERLVRSGDEPTAMLPICISVAVKKMVVDVGDAEDGVSVPEVVGEASHRGLGGRLVSLTGDVSVPAIAV